MIKKIQLRGFRGYAEFELVCKNYNCIVGPNNAGKSTLLDALRILSDILRYAYRRRSQTASNSDGRIVAQHIVPISQIGVTTANVAYNYSHEPAELRYTHENGNTLTIYVHPDKQVVAELDTQDRIVRSVSDYREHFPINLVVVPTLGPFEEEEAYFLDSTVEKNMNTRLAHRNFRNILYRMTSAEYGELQELVSQTWPDVTLQRPERYGHPAQLTLMYNEGRMPREVHWAGFGFQVWLQLLLQILRGKTTDSVLVLDEPDVYLHADLQRRLTRLARDRFKQVFIATHSAEIINELSPGEIVSVSRAWRTGRRVQTDEGYRALFSYVGSSENAEFARLARSRRIMFFEGEDRKLLKRVLRIAKADNLVSDPDTILMKADGFGNWSRITGAAWTLKNALEMDVKIGALFDRDYRCDGEVEKFESGVSSEEIMCRVLRKKELENYLLVPDLLVRSIIARLNDRGKSVSESEALSMIDEILESHRGDVHAACTGFYVKHMAIVSKEIDPVTVVGQANKLFEGKWKVREDALSLVPGKAFISDISRKLQTDFGSSLSPAFLASRMQASEIDDEIVDLANALHSFFRS